MVAVVVEVVKVVTRLQQDQERDLPKTSLDLVNSGPRAPFVIYTPHFQLWKVTTDDV